VVDVVVGPPPDGALQNGSRGIERRVREAELVTPPVHERLAEREARRVSAERSRR